MNDSMRPVAIDVAQGELVDAAGRAVVLRRRSLGVLMSLARGVDRVVSKDEIIAANWPGRAVSDESLARCVSDIRSVLGPRLRSTVKTVSGRGYMLRGWYVTATGMLLADETPEPGVGPPSVAVLPFASHEEENCYFAEGIAQEIIDGLSRVRSFFVIASGSSFTYRNRDVDLATIGRDLGVRYILDGSVRKGSGRVRISGRLVEAESGRQLWTGRHEGTLDDIFDLQDSVAAQVVAAVEPNVRLAEIARAQSRPTGNARAYDLHLRALPLLYAYTRASFAEAVTLLREAVSRDPGYSDALASLADCIGRMALNGWRDDREAVFAESCAFASRAVSADPANPTTLATAAWAYAMFSGGFDQAFDLADQALALHHNSHAIRSYCGWVFTYGGESDRAIEQFEEARRLSPIDPRGYFPLLGVATAHYFARRFAETERIARRILSEVPEHNIARRYLAAALAQMGRNDEAAEALQGLLAAQPDYSLAAARGSRFRHRWMLDLWLDGLAKAGLT